MFDTVKLTYNSTKRSRRLEISTRNLYCLSRNTQVNKAKIEFEAQAFRQFSICIPAALTGAQLKQKYPRADDTHTVRTNHYQNGSQNAKLCINTNTRKI